MGHLKRPVEGGVSCWAFFAPGVSTTMAGQNVERREVLRVLAIAAAAAPFTGFSKWAFGCGHLSHTTTQIKPAVYKPLFFTAAEFADVDGLTDVGELYRVITDHAEFEIGDLADGHCELKRAARTQSLRSPLWDFRHGLASAVDGAIELS
jgi:hypothetical protein